MIASRTKDIVCVAVVGLVLCQQGMPGRGILAFRDVLSPVGFMRELAVSRSMHIAVDFAFVACYSSK